jgi:hypothetical protein
MDPARDISAVLKIVVLFFLGHAMAKVLAIKTKMSSAMEVATAIMKQHAQ